MRQTRYNSSSIFQERQQLFHPFSFAKQSKTINLKRFDEKIQKAILNYQKVNNSYKSRHQDSLMTGSEKKELKKQQTKFDRATALTRLRHLENQIQNQKAEQQLQKKLKWKGLKMNKHWKKYAETIKVSYLQSYKNYLEEKIDNFEEDTQKSENESFTMNQIYFEKELKKTPKFFQFTKKRLMERKKQFQGRNRKTLITKSLQHQKELVNKKIQNEFQQIIIESKSHHFDKRKQQKSEQIKKIVDNFVDKKINMDLNQRKKSRKIKSAHPRLIKS